MESLVKGVHHITLCVGGAQEDVDFFTKVLGQRMVKQTVLMDGSIPIYHLYYANADVELGSVATSFPYSRKPGRAGSGRLGAGACTFRRGAARSSSACPAARAAASGWAAASAALFASS